MVYSSFVEKRHTFSLDGVPRERIPWSFVIKLDELAAVRGAATAL